jgi:hypothetical protein
VRKVREGEVTTDIFAFLTTEPNSEVGRVHPKAMPDVIESAASRSGSLPSIETGSAVQQKMQHK